MPLKMINPHHFVMKKVFLPLLLVLLLPVAAQAQDQNDPCEDADSTLEINDCMGEGFKLADAELNRVYKAAMAHIDENDHMPARTRRDWKQLLLEAQRHWITFKEKDCDLLQLEWWQGSGATAAMLGCLISKTETRTNELKERYAVE